MTDLPHHSELDPSAEAARDRYIEDFLGAMPRSAPGAVPAEEVDVDELGQPAAAGPRISLGSARPAVAYLIWFGGGLSLLLIVCMLVIPEQTLRVVRDPGQIVDWLAGLFRATREVFFSS